MESLDGWMGIGSGTELSMAIVDEFYSGLFMMKQSELT